MSNPESFVDEVNEDLRRDRLFGLMRRYGWIAVLAVLALVGGASYKEWTAAKARSAAQAKGDAIIAALTDGDLAAQAAALGDVDGVIARLSQAATLTAAEDYDAALAVYTAIAQDPDLGPLYQDLAVLKGAMIAQAGTPDTRRDALTSIGVPGRPYRMLAQEQLAMIDLSEGATGDAVTLLKTILEDAETSPSQKTRVATLLTALGQDNSTDE